MCKGVKMPKVFPISHSTPTKRWALSEKWCNVQRCKTCKIGQRCKKFVIFIFGRCNIQMFCKPNSIKCKFIIFLLNTILSFSIYLTESYFFSDRQKLDCIFALLGSEHVKATSEMLVKLTPERC